MRVYSFNDFCKKVEKKDIDLKTIYIEYLDSQVIKN